VHSVVFLAPCCVVEHRIFATQPAEQLEGLWRIHQVKLALLLIFDQFDSQITFSLRFIKPGKQVDQKFLEVRSFFLIILLEGVVEVEQVRDELLEVLLSLHQVDERVGQNLNECLGLEYVPALLLAVVDLYQVL